MLNEYLELDIKTATILEICKFLSLRTNGRTSVRYKLNLRVVNIIIIWA